MVQETSGPQSVSASGGPELLVLRSSPPRERADAARNRAAVLAAAAELFREKGVDAVSMDAVAAAAGVGKGTLFRRFTDKAGLAAALLDERERELQEAILSGPAPLGPGGPDENPAARDRLVAFVDAYLDYALAHLDVLAMSESASPGARYRVGAYRFWHRHVTILLAAASSSAPASGPGRGMDLAGVDPETDAHAVLAPLAAVHLRAIVGELGEARVRRSALAVAAALIGRSPVP